MFFDPLNSLTLQNDRSFRASLHADPQSYYSDSETDIILLGHSCSHPRPGPSITSRSQNSHLKCDRNLGWNIDWAVAFIVDYLEKKSDATEALRAIRIRAATLERDGRTRDIPDRIFNTLDETLFAGLLRNAVYLGCSSLNADVSGATHTPNSGPYSENKRISIILNSDFLNCARAKDVVAILIHHMIHAYFLIACGPQKEEEVDYGRLGHSHHFGKVMTAIRQFSAAHGKEFTGLSYGHGLGDGYDTDGYYRPLRRLSRNSDSERENWYCSHCHSNVYEIPDSELNKWYTKAIQPMLDQPCKAIRSATVQIYNDRIHELETRPRARLPASTKTLEFIYKDKSTLISAAHLDDLPCLKLAFVNTKSRFLRIHAKDATDGTFLRLLEFIHTRACRPDPFALVSSSRRAPPIIKPSSGSNQPFVLFDVQFANLGAVLGCGEAVSYALKRMNAYGVMSEDPVAVLEEIFRGREPERKVKAWVRGFLVARPEGGGVPNLVRLESEEGPWRARFHGAMEASGGLENEVRKAWAAVSQLGNGPTGLLALGDAAPFEQQLTQMQTQTQQLLLAAAGLRISDLRPTSNIDAAQLQLANLLSSSSSYTNNTLANNPFAALELEYRRAVQRHKFKTIEKEKKDMELRDSRVQGQVAAMLETMCGRDIDGIFVDEDEDEDDEYW
jgi:hypothetical protein